MRKLFQSPLRTFVTIALVWFTVAGAAASCGLLAAFFALADGGFTGSGRAFGNLSHALLGFHEAMSFPFGGLAATELRYFLLAVVFWAGVLTLILWVTRTIYRRLFYP